jgi:hypothetical protein
MGEVRGVRGKEEATARAREGDQYRYATGGDGCLTVSRAFKGKLEAGREQATHW